MIKYLNNKIVACILLISGTIFFMAPFKSALLINKSDSLPYKCCFLIKGQNWQKYDVVAIQGFATTYTKDQHFTKQVVGVAGDLITVIGEQVLVNGISCPLKAKTKDNKQLTPMAAQVIPQQHFFVMAEHKDSFDSRYQEFGLVQGEYIEGKVIPIW